MSPYHRPPQQGPPGGLTPEQLAEYYRQLMSLGQGVVPPVPFQAPWDPVTSVQRQEELTYGRKRRRVDPVPNPMLPREGESRVDHRSRLKGYEEAQRLGQETPLGYGQPVPQTPEGLTQAFADASQRPGTRQLDMYGEERLVPAAFDKPGAFARGVAPAAVGFVGRNVAGALKLGGRMLPGDPADPSTLGSSVVGAADWIREQERQREEAFQGQFRSVIRPDVMYDKPNPPGWMPGMTTGEIATTFALEGGKYIVGGGAVRKLGAKGVAMLGGTRFGAATAAALTARFAPKVAAVTRGAARIAPRTTAVASGAARFLKDPLLDVAAFLPLDVLTTQYDEDSIAFVAGIFTDPEVRAQWEQDPESFYSKHLTGDKAQWGINKLNELSAKAMESEIGKAAFEAGFGFAADIALRGGFRAVMGTGRGLRRAGQELADPAGVARRLEGLDLGDPDPFGVGDRFPEIGPRTEQPDFPELGLDRLEGPATIGPEVRLDELGQPVDPDQLALGRALEGPTIGPEVRRPPEVRELETRDATDRRLALEAEEIVRQGGVDPRRPNERYVYPDSPEQEAAKKAWEADQLRTTTIPEPTGLPERLPGEVVTGLEGRWYSRLQAAIETAPTPLPGGKATGQEWNRFLDPAKRGFGEMEAGWTGLRKYLDDNADEVLTKDDVLSFARENEIRLKERRRGGAQADWEPQYAHQTQGEFGLEPKSNYEEIVVQLDRPARAPRDRATQEPPGYKVTTSSPPPEAEAGVQGYSYFEGEDVSSRTYNTPTEARAAAWAQYDANRSYGMPEPGGFTQGHFPEKDALGHIRKTDREVTAVGGRAAKGKSFHIEELQSDWHQKGRKHGYVGQIPEEVDPSGWTANAGSGAQRMPTGRWIVYNERGGVVGSGVQAASPEEAIEATARQIRAEPISERGAVPDAPYKKTSEWVGLLVRRALQAAVRGGYDRISWATGAQAADLSDLRKYVSRIDYHEETGTLEAWDLEGARVVNKSGITPEKLPDHVGKDPAARLMEPVGAREEELAAARALQREELAAARALQRDAAEKYATEIERSIREGTPGPQGLFDEQFRSSAVAVRSDPDAFVETLESYGYGYEQMEELRRLEKRGSGPVRNLRVEEGPATRDDLIRTNVDVREHIRTEEGDRIFRVLDDNTGEVMTSRVTREAAEEVMERMGRTRSIEGDDLVVGGHGMAAFYDRHVPNAFMKELKKYGAVLEEVDVIPPEKGARIVEFEGIDPDADVEFAGMEPMFKWVDAEGRVIPESVDPRGFLSRAEAEEWGNILRAEGDPRFTEEAARTGERNLSIKITPRIREGIEGGTRLAMPPRLVGPAAVGGVAGAAAPAETPEERARNIFAGATLAGVGGVLGGSAIDVLGGSRRLTGNQLRTGIPTPEVPSRQAPSRYINIPDEKVANNLSWVIKNREKSAATGKPMPGNPNNPRTVIRAAPGSGNPDVVVGDITQDDWIQRTESLLNPEEIAASARWYQEVFPQFEKAAGGDAEEIKKLVAAWLSANQNQSPENALKQVLRVREHVLRGVPYAQLPAAGLPGVTRAVHDILTGKQATTVGPKISDFFDSAEGRSLRTWMGMDPEGGAPFVVDIHTARDTGLVDERLVSILKRRGYDSEALDALKIEKPAAAKYENRAEWGRRLTNDLNARNWMGRSDWKPSEIQAVGWAAMRKITAEADVQGIPDVIEQSTRRIAFEVLPGKGSVWDKQYGQRLLALPPEGLARVTRKVGEDALRRAARETGVKDLAAVVHSLGGWEGAVTPNIAGRFLASREGMDAITARLGYYLDQTEVLGSTLRPDIKKPKAYAVDFLEVGTKTLRDDAALENFWKVIQDADDTGAFKGFMPVEYPDGSAGVRVIFDLSYGSKDIGGLGANKLLASLAPGGAIYKALEGLDFDVDTRSFQAELSKSVNDFKGAPNGQGHIQRLTDITGGGPTATDLLNRKELTRALEEALGAAEGRAGDPGAGGARAGVDPGTTLGFGLGGAPPAMLAGAARVGGKAAVGGLAGALLDASVGEDPPIEGMLVGAALAVSPSLVRGFKKLRVRAEVADDAIDSALQQTLAAEQIAREAPEMMEGVSTATPPPEGVPPRTPAADKIDPEEFVNIKKFGLEPGSTEERLKEAVQEVVDQTGMDPKEVVTHEQTIRIAESLGLDAQDIARRLGGAGGAPAGAEMLAARNIISSNTRRVHELFQQLQANNIHIDSDEAAPYVAQINVLQGETNSLLAKYMPASSATGRALNAMKVAAQDTMDPATWVIRAARVSGVPELPPSISAEITRLTNAEDKQGLMKLLADLHKSDISEQIVTLGKAAMLSGLPTHAMNLLSTAYNVFGVEHIKDLPASWFDSILSSWAGTERTKHWGSVAAQLDAAKKGAWQGVQSAKDVFHGRLPEGSLERWDQIRQVNVDLARRTPLLKSVPKLPQVIDRSLDVFQKTVFGALGAGDALLTGFAVQRSLAEQARVIALNEGLKGAELAARAAAILAGETTPEMMLEAVAQGMLATFRNQGIVGRGITGLKRGIRETAKKTGGLLGVGDPAHTATYMVTEALVPWSMTPANVTTRVAEASPLGLVMVAADSYFWKLVTRRVTKESPEAQKRIVERLGRSTVGAAPILLGIYLYGEKLLSLGWRQEKAGQREITGEEENAWLMGDDWISMERMSPGGNLVILGGHIAHEWANARRDVDTGTAADIGATALGAGLSIGKTAYEQSFLESLRRLGDFFSGAERETGRKNILAGTAGMFVPNILKRLNRWADPTMRPRETVGDKLLEGIPGGARLLGRPARVDPFGETRKYREGFYATMVDPFQMSRDKTIDNPVRALMRDLDISISRRQKMDEETAQMYEQRQRMEGKALEAAIGSLMGSSEFLSVGRQAEAELPPGTDAKTMELVTKAVQAGMIENLITSERTKYTKSYRAALARRQLTGAGR